MDSTRTVTYSYGCGGYITKGKSVCQMNPIPQEKLESKVIDTVLGFYQPYLEKNGREKIATIVKEQTGFEKQDSTNWKSAGCGRIADLCLSLASNGFSVRSSRL